MVDDGLDTKGTSMKILTGIITAAALFGAASVVQAQGMQSGGGMAPKGSMAMDCTTTGMSNANSAAMKMTDKSKQDMAMKEMGMAKESMAKKDMSGCKMHMDKAASMMN